MAVSIFWSWQSDLPARETRDLARDALDAAIKELAAEIEEAARPTLTSDTKGVAGTPDIVATIFAKIEASAVFVADLTPVGNSIAGKPLANPNVMIELGYAKRALGPERIVLLWNTACPGTTPDALPFDLRGRRAPIGFNAPNGIERKNLTLVRQTLTKTLVEALRASIATVLTVEPAVRLRDPSATTQALWFDPSEELTINEDGESGRKAVLPGPYAYVRLLPSSWRGSTSLGNEHLGILGHTMGYSWGMTRGGFITYTGSIRASGDSPLRNFTMQFRETGEIWGVDASMYNNEGEKYLYAFDLLRAWDRFIERHISRLSSEGSRFPITGVIGVAPIEGLVWPSNAWQGRGPVALEENFEHPFSLSSASPADRRTILRAAWDALRCTFGISPATEDEFNRDFARQ